MVQASGWYGYCAGPHRLLYESAQSLARKGLGTVRFDYYGRGYSDGRYEDASFARAVEDTRTVTAYVRRRFGDECKLVVIGLSYGAAVGLACVDEWTKMVLWCPEARGTASVSIRLQTILSRYRVIMRKLWDLRTLRRLITGKARFGSAMDWLAGERERPYEITFPSRRRKSFLAGLIVLAENDPIKKRARMQYQEVLNALEIPHQFTEIAGADHSLSSLVAKRRAIAITKRWLTDDYVGIDRTLRRP